MSTAENAAKQATYKRDGFKCRHCLFRQNLHAHHVQFKSHNGPDIQQNLLTLCNLCHEAVHACKLLIKVRKAFTEVVMTGSNFENVETGQIKFMRLQGWKPQ